MRKIKKFSSIAILLVLAAAFAALFIDIKTILIIFLTSLLFVGYVIYKEKIGQELLVAFLFAAFITSYYIYEYTTSNILLGRINLFPLISWTFSLVLLREIYERMRNKHKIILISLFYLFVLFILEYLGFYLAGIRLNSNFPSLFGSGIIHAPLPMQIFYLLAGPVYLLATDYLRVK